MNSNQETIAIIVSGGPAPGVNSVIAAVTIQGMAKGYNVKGFQKGFAGIIEKGSESLVDLCDLQMSAIANTGGSIIGTSRFNPFATKEYEQKLISTLESNNVNSLVVIGGEGSAYLSYKITEKYPKIKVVHVPKTIDNDLILPNKQPSFGFETARFVGSNTLKNIIAEAKTTTRWFIVKTMGRKSGFLALGMGIASGATLTVIGEQFADKKTIMPIEIAQIIFNSIKKRHVLGKSYGTAIIAEGLIDKFDITKVPELKNAPRDDMGRIRFTEVSLEDIIARQVRELCAANNIKMRISVSSLGYELRCSDPVPFDIEYTKLLGFGAVKFLSDGISGIMVVKDFDNIAYVPLESMIESDSGLIRTRKVDLNSDTYKVASSFMIK